MKETPIIFSTDMVKAILDGRKTQTRRVIKDPRRRKQGFMSIARYGEGRPSVGDLQREIELTKDTPPNFPCPFGQVGDRLWVREKYAFCAVDDRTTRALYFDNTYTDISFDKYDKMQLGWHPSIHMPRWASRINLEITGVRVERLQEIDSKLADLAVKEYMKEGLGLSMELSLGQPYWLQKDMLRQDFIKLWDSLNAKRGYGWDTNPYVWVIEFKRIEV